MENGGLDLCTGSVYCVLCTGSTCSCRSWSTCLQTSSTRRTESVYCVLCTVYWICVLDLRTRTPRRRVAARCVLDLCTVYCVLDLAVFVLSPVRCVRAYSTVCCAVLHVGATRRPGRCDASTSYVRRVDQVGAVRRPGRCDASTRWGPRVDQVGAVLARKFVAVAVDP